MKRFLIFLAFVIIFIALGIVDKDLLHLRKKYPDMKVIFYTTSKDQLQNHNNTVYDGVYHQVRCDAKDAVKVKNALNDIKGMSVSFWGTRKDIDYILDLYDVKIISEKWQNNILYIYGYSDLIFVPAFKVNDDYINIQLSFRKNRVTAGVPIILGSY